MYHCFDMDWVLDNCYSILYNFGHYSLYPCNRMYKFHWVAMYIHHHFDTADHHMHAGCMNNWYHYTQLHTNIDTLHLVNHHMSHRCYTDWGYMDRNHWEYHNKFHNIH